VLAEGKANVLAAQEDEKETTGADGAKKKKTINVDWLIVTKAGKTSQITKVLTSAAADKYASPALKPAEGDLSAIPDLNALAPVLPFTDREADSTEIMDTITGAVTYRIMVDIKKKVKDVVWHHKGDYFATVSPQQSATSVLVHRLSKGQSQSPFGKPKGLVQRVCFHPNKPFFFVASQRHVRVYNLGTQTMVKKLLCPAKWISSLAVHPQGDHLIVGSYDRRVSWFDMDLANTPYKTLKYHQKAVRGVAFHPTYPLFASCSDDGNLHIFHGKVFTDLLTNPLIVPVKILKVQTPKNDLGLLHCQFHPSQPWILASGSDHTLRLFT
jgi:WD40 repeat protein